MEAITGQDRRTEHGRDFSRDSDASGRSLEPPYPTTSSFNSLATNAGDHHLFEQAFTARLSEEQEKELYESHPHSHALKQVLASPSSILNSYQRPSIDQAVPPVNPSYIQSLETVQDDAQQLEDALEVDGKSSI